MLALLAALSLLVPASPRDDGEPLRVFLRGGPKTHGEGEHDHPLFVEQWKRLLAERGCEVRGALEFPSAEALEASDVLVLYAAEGASIHGDERARLERFLARGGGLVVLHDAVCGDDPHWFKTVAGGAWEHGRSKWLEGEVGIVLARSEQPVTPALADREHPITRGAASFDLEDEIYWDLHLDPDARVLASSFHTPFDVKPQMWVLERGAYRAFVSLQGHETSTFSNPAWRTLVLRGIAWAARRDADALVRPEELAELRYPPGGPRAPERAAEALVVHPEFELSLVAAEPLVVNPISLDWDARGRMWVALTPGYPEKQEFSGLPARDEVVVLSDADGDGRMDGRSVFAGGLDLVTSLVFHDVGGGGDGVIVSQSPEILWLRDRDGDGAADERVVLFSGFGYRDTHAVVSNMRRGPDGWIYATQGYSGNDSRRVLGRDGEDRGAIGNGVFRFRPDGSAIEMVSAYGSNTWGLDFAWDGDLFFSMANGSHLRHVVASERELAAGRLAGVESWLDVTDHGKVFPLRAHERPPYQQIDFVGGFTGASGACLYTGGAWPAELDGAAFVCEPTVNLVHHDSLAPRGVSYSATKVREPEFVASTDLWFRPVHLRVGPDGALYVLDFYNQAAVHNDTRGPEHGPTNAAVRPDRDHQHGRIWRVQHRAARPQAVPPLAGASERELAAALTHANGWVRDTARRLLAERPKLEPATLAALAEQARGAAAPAARASSLWALPAARRGDALAETLRGAVRDPDAGVRKAALRVLADVDEWQGARALLRPEEVLHERDERARLAGLFALRRSLGDEGLEAVVEALPALGDDWSRSAVLALAARRPARFLDAALAARDSAELERVVRALAARVAAARDLGAAVELVTALGQREKQRGTERARIAIAVLEELARGLDPAEKPWPSPRLDRALVALLGSADADVALAALPLCARWSDGRSVQDARNALGARLGAVAGDEGAPPERRLAAVEALLSLPGRHAEGAALAAAFLDPRFALEHQLRALELLAREPELAAELCARLEGLSRPARERALAALLSRPESSATLLDALEREELDARGLGPHALHALRAHPDEGTAARAARVLDALVGAEREDKQALLEELAPLVDRPGDAARGRELFAANCANCHTFAGSGAKGGVGPDLTGMGAHGARELLPFLLDPNRAVEPGYVEYVVETTDGELVAGVITRETSESLVLASSAGTREVPRARVASLRSTGRSPMPTGFESLGAEGLRDLLAYLAGDWAGFRLVDLRSVCSSSTSRGLYDTVRDAKPMRLRARGVVGVDGVPFELLDPARMDGERDALTLRGGMGEGWESRGYPQRVELPLGFALARLHVLGGIAAWGFPYTSERAPAVKLTWSYADGSSEERVLTDGVEFADWISRYEVPGSRWVDLLAEGSFGQLRTFSVAPGRPAEVVRSLVLESFDNHLAPTFLALTAELPGARPAVAEVPAEAAPATRADVLVFGGGSSHDFTRWFGGADVETIAATGRAVAYSESPQELAAALGSLSVLVLCNNQPLSDPGLRAALLGFVARGGGLVLVHAATWHNWEDWPEFNRELVGGGARGHDAYGEFAVSVLGEHELVRGLPRSFTIRDELYRFEPDLLGKLQVLATGRALAGGPEYPVLWTRAHGEGRVVGLTLGHDGAAHEHAAYRAVLANAVRWAAGG